MTARHECRLDRNACGPGLTIDDGGTIVTTNLNALDAYRAVFGNLAVSEGIKTFEFHVYSTSRGDLSGLVSVGVAEVGTALDDLVGGNATSYGIMPADGVIMNNGLAVTTFEAFNPERICMSVTVDLTGPTKIVRWAWNGSSTVFRTLPANKLWVPAISIGGEEAGDLCVIVNFGQDRFDAQEPSDGWYTETVGRATLYLSSVTEGFLSANDDTPANQSYRPAILNPGAFSVRRAPQAWVHSGGSEFQGGTTGVAAIASLRLDNSKGQFNWLLREEAEGSTIVYQAIPGRDGSGTLTDAVTHMTARLARAWAPSPSVIEVTLSDILLELRRPMRCRRIPPFADASSRGRTYPVAFGAQRNRRPLLFDQATLTYILGDAPQGAVAAVYDGGQRLDPGGTPPQYRPALGGCGFQLDTDAEYRISVDCSNVGGGYDIPTDEDVLGGIGDFATWASGEPVGWDRPAAPPLVVANGSITQTSSYGSPSACLISSFVPLSPGSSPTYFGYYIKTTAAFLEPGRTYRISIRLLRVNGTPNQYLDQDYGLAVLSKLTYDPRFWISGHRQPIYQWEGGNLTFDYTVPSTELAALPLYLSVISRTQSGNPPTAVSCIAVVDDVKVQLRGQYEPAELEGITLTQAFREILVVREGHPDGVFSTADTQFLDDATGIRLGVCWEEQPASVEGALQELADTYCAVVFTDANGIIRVKRFADPNLDTPVALLDEANIDPKSVSIDFDALPGLTTNIGCARNCEPLAPGDFTTDTAGVPPTQREQWSGNSQIRFSTSTRPAQAYAAANGAPWFHMLCDLEGPARAEAERVVGIAAMPQVDVGNGLAAIVPGNEKTPTGKRNKITLRAWTVNGMLGNGLAVPARDVMYGTVLQVNLPDLDLDNVSIGVLEWEPAPAGDWIEIVGHYR